jgi:hypothetical protein
MATDSVSENPTTEQIIPNPQTITRNKPYTINTFQYYTELLCTGTYLIQALDELNNRVDEVNRLATRFSEIAKKIGTEDA